MVKCYFCGSRDFKILGGAAESPYPANYKCPRCGHVYLEEECAEDIDGENFTTKQLRNISIFIRNKYEGIGLKRFSKSLSIEDLRRIIAEYPQLDPLEQMNDVLLKLESSSMSFGDRVEIKNIDNDFPYYRCSGVKELLNLLVQLHKDGLIDAKDPYNPQNGLSITTKGYEKIGKIKANRRGLPEKKEGQILDPKALYAAIQDQVLKERCLDILSAKNHFDRVVNQATLVLEDRIRERSRVEGLEGVNLVNKALNSKLEKSILKVSDDPSIHEGICHICRGIMLAFRNPTHHKIIEGYTRADALKVCAFIDNLLCLIENAKT